VTKCLDNQVRELDDFIGALNRLVHGDWWAPGALSTDGTKLDNPNREFTRSPQGVWGQAMQIIADAGLAEWSGGMAVRFKAAESAG